MRRTLFACLAAICAGCVSFHTTQTAVFVNEDGQFISVEYGRGDEDHTTVFVSPATHKPIELKSKLRVKVQLPDGGRGAICRGQRFLAYRCMNQLRSGTMYKTDDEKWMFHANGFTCTVFRQTEDKRDYLLVFEGVICEAPKKVDKKK